MSIAAIINVMILLFTTSLCIVQAFLSRSMKISTEKDLRRSCPEDYGEDLGDYWYEYYLSSYNHYKRWERMMFTLAGLEFICLISYIVIKIIT